MNTQKHKECQKKRMEALRQRVKARNASDREYDACVVSTIRNRLIIDRLKAICAESPALVIC